MREIIDSIRRVLRRDVLLNDMIGVDQDGEPKIYHGIAKENVEAPYIVLSVLTGDPGIATYGDDHAIETISLQITSWGNTSREAWELADVVDEAVPIGKYDAGKFVFMRGKRITFPNELNDRDSNLIQVPVLYEFQFGKEAFV
jgi:hypothetical protein